MFCVLLLACVLSSAASGQIIKDDDKLQSVLKELDFLRNSMRGYRDLSDEVDKLKVRTNALEDEVEELKEENMGLHSKVEHLETKLKEVFQFEDENTNNFKQNFVPLHDMHNTTRLTKKDIATSKTERTLAGIQKRQVPVDTRVAFTAGVSAPDLVGLGQYQTIVFDKTISNVGNAYHPHTGIFFAPVSGVYVFTVTLMVTRGHSQYLGFMIDGVQIGDVYCGAGQINATVSSMRHWVVEVNKGSDVWVRAENRGQVRGYMHSDFSGFLLYQNQ